ncbi:hypothetical protein CAI21_18320 [Alkalilimnicola ehrlichii]|uniref:Uncharacterized protein n=1 Tax=Alkalilimnicola ehrlichii TaxID=351052 RepID=A0A3E0WSZ7_9GAMM|nr:hypothetical protein [Alkalilimnicola ehrlichii]RFA25811.1 hypothetical protein CAI21_18320 [Alkalilimnicola ehrlichii]RFA35087.1 hypothetical protein CAL65_13320 [Alkalilimnicola ehrlichii]
MARRNTNDVQVVIGRGVVIVKRPADGERLLAVILQTEGGAERPTRVRLDRRIHRPGETRLGEWGVAGDSNSVLERLSA